MTFARSLFRQAWIGPSDWIIFGLGPTFARRGEIDNLTRPMFYRVGELYTMALNDAIKHTRPDLGHCIDIEAARRLGSKASNARYLAMPWHPHHNYVAGEKTLWEWADETPALARMRDAGRLLWYNLCTWGKGHHGNTDVDKVVRVKFFSAEAAVYILAAAGARKIRLCGVDGGTEYSGEFDPKEKFRAGHDTFDKQWPEIRHTIREFGLDVAHLFGAPGRGLQEP